MLSTPSPARSKSTLFSSHSDFSFRPPQTPKMKPLNFSSSDGSIGFSPRRQESFSMFETSASPSPSHHNNSDGQQQQQRTTKFSFGDLQQMNLRQQQQQQRQGSPVLKPLVGDRFNVFKKRENKLSVIAPSSSSPASPRMLPFNKK